MDYQIKQNESELNYDKENHLINFTILAVFLGGIFALIVFVVANFVEIAIKFIPEGKEYEIFATHNPSSHTPSTPKELALKAIIDKLSPCIELKNKFDISIINDPTPNAFATLTSQIYINSGIFKHIKTQNGLAFVLAHEMSHFKHRDHLKGLGSGLILSLIFSSFNSNSLNEILSNQATSKYSQAQELAADNEALNVLNCAYGHIGGAGEFFESILQNGDRNLIENLFDTHPTLKKRIQNINNSKLPKNKAIMLNLD